MTKIFGPGDENVNPCSGPNGPPWIFGPGDHFHQFSNLFSPNGPPL